MNEKQTAELLGGLRTAFLNRANRDGVLSRFWGMVGDRTAGQEDAANYAARLGEVLSETLLEETVAIGDGRVRFAEALADTDPDELLNTVNGTLGQLMKHAYRMVNDAGAQAQKIADEANGLGLRSVLGNYPDERLQGLYRKIAEAAEQSQVASHQSEEKSAQDADRRAERVGAPPVGGDRKSGGTVESWLGEPVVNNVQAFYDEHVRANAEARFHAGLAPVIVRTAAPGCCNWCASRAGVYEYDSVQDKGNEVFRRHKFCRCTVAYFCDGARTEVWGRKHWEADRQTLEQRKTYGLDNKKTLPAPSEEYVRQEEGKVLAKAAERGIITGDGKEPDFYAGLKGKVLAKKYKEWIGDNEMQDYLDRAVSETAKIYIRSDFRPSSFIGDGSTAAIRKFEKETGLMCGRNGKSHAKKANDLINQITHALEQKLPDSDVKMLTEILKRLKEVN